MKLAIYSCALNEAKNITRFVRAIVSELQPGDDFLILDTGSMDSTPAIARALADPAHRPRVHTAHIRPWRFDVAKNTALALVSPDVDMAWLLDIDEIPRPGWREAIENAWVANGGDCNGMRYRFIWSHDEQGGDGVVLMADKLHSRWGWQWKGIAHEWPVREDGQAHWAFVPGLEIDHWQDTSINRLERDMQLMERAIKDLPDDDRLQHYYARQLFFAGRYVEASLAFQKHLGNPRAWWRHERSESMLYLARCGGNTAWEHQWLFRALGECPERRETWKAVAEWEHKQGHTGVAIRLLERALSTPHEELYLSQPDCRDQPLRQRIAELRAELEIVPNE